MPVRSVCRPHRRGWSLIGLLISFGLIVILFAMSMTALNKAVTGEGSAQVNTVRSMEDKMNLYGIMQSMIVYSNEHDDWFPVPSDIAGRDDWSLNTTANLYSAMIALQYARPEQLVAGNEYSGYVEVMHDYDYQAYRPADGTFWDTRFKADLDDLSHVSYAHLPLFGGRFDTRWGKTLDGTFPLVGNRGPKGGIEDPASMTYGRNGRWAGHLAFADGHVDFVEAFTLPNLFMEGEGGAAPDNIFAAEQGPGGGDAILSFTRRMEPGGPVLQHD